MKLIKVQNSSYPGVGKLCLPNKTVLNYTSTTRGGLQVNNFCLLLDDTSFNYAETISHIKNVIVTREDFEKRMEDDDKKRQEGYNFTFDNPYYGGGNESLKYHVWYNDEMYKGTSHIKKVAYDWASEFRFARSCSDITEVYDMITDKVEYYYTEEILKCLEAWSDMQEKWKNPEERQKLIDEYEQSQKSD